MRLIETKWGQQEKKSKVKEDKKDAEEVRNGVMESLRDRMKRSKIEGKGNRRGSSGNNTLEYLKQRNERLDEFKEEEEELELKKQELQQEAEKNEAMTKLMGQQLIQQQKQMDGFQTMMITMFSKFLEKN